MNLWWNGANYKKKIGKKGFEPIPVDHEPTELPITQLPKK